MNVEGGSDLLQARVGDRPLTVILDVGKSQLGVDPNFVVLQGAARAGGTAF